MILRCMGIKTVIKNGDIIVRNTGSGNASGFSIESKITPKAVQSVSTNFTVTVDAGTVYAVSGTVSGTTTVITGTFPAPAESVGQIYTVRKASEHTLVLTGSSAAMFVSGNGTTHGSKAMLSGTAALVEASVTLLSDGVRYVPLFTSGTFTVST